MRRLAILAAALAVACSSKEGGTPPPSDTTPPAPPTIAFPAAGATLAAVDLDAGHLVLSGAAEPGATVKVEVDGTEVGQAVATAGGSWAVAAAVPADVADGAHAVRARAVDGAGNDSGPCAAVPFTLDATAPLAPAIDAPQPFATAAAELDVIGSTEANATVRVRLDGAVVAEASADGAGAFVVQVALPGSDGVVSLTAVAVDAAGNVSPPSAAVAITVDRTPPAAPIVSEPAEGAFVASASVRVAGTAEPYGMVRVAPDAGQAIETPTGQLGAWEVTLTLADGARALTVRAIDAAGNFAETARAFTVDTLAPAAPAIAAPLDGASLVSTDLVNGQVVLAGTAEAGATVHVEVDAGTSGALTVATVAAADRTWSVGAALASGAHTASAWASDAAGNASGPSGTVAFTLDTTRVATRLDAGAPAPVASWGQTVAVAPDDRSGLGEVFPGQANDWVLDADFSLARGFGAQYANALLLYVGTPTAPPSHATLLQDLLADVYDAFPGDQDASDVAWLTPPFGVADGLVTAAASDGATMGVPRIAGALSGYLNATPDSRLSRTLDLAAGGTYTFSWKHEAVLSAGRLAGAPAPSYQVVLRDPGTGAVVGAPLFSSSTDVPRATASVARANLPAQVVLSFELRSAEPGYAELDDVAVTDGSGPVSIANGGFEDGLLGWEASDGAASQNVRSGARDVGAPGETLRVTRTFYAPPAATWGRLVDVFENVGTADVTTTAIYVTTLNGALPVAAATQGGAAVVGWDGAPTWPVRDVGIAFGSGAAHVADADPFVFVTHELTVPAGGKVALLHFVVQLGEAAGGTTAADVPPGTDGECAAILAGYPALAPYRVDFEAGVRALVANL